MIPQAKGGVSKPLGACFFWWGLWNIDGFTGRNGLVVRVCTLIVVMEK